MLISFTAPKGLFNWKDGIVKFDIHDLALVLLLTVTQYLSKQVQIKSVIFKILSNLKILPWQGMIT